MFEYVTAQEAAELWGISARRVQRLCKENRIEGVLNINRVWLMPINIKAKLAFLVYPILIWRALIRILKKAPYLYEIFKNVQYPLCIKIKKGNETLWISY